MDTPEQQSEIYVMEPSRHQLDGYGHPVALPYASLTTGSSCFKYDCSVKEDGWRLIIARDDLGICYVFSKGGIALKTSTCAMLRAIGLYYDEHFMARLHPSKCRIKLKDGTGPIRTATALLAEFVAMKEYPCGKVRSCLEDLLSGACLKDGKLCTEGYSYHVKIFDAVFQSATKKLIREPWSDRIAGVIKAYGQECAVTIITSESQFRQALLSGEGIVGHGKMFYNPCEELPQIVKVKMPKVPMRLEIIGVVCTLPDFEGWDLIYLSANGATSSEKHIVIVYDFTDILKWDSASKSKVRVNPKSVKRNKFGVVECKSKSVLGPILNALYAEISGTKLYSAGNVKPTSAMIRDNVKVVCGTVRKRLIHREIQFLQPRPAVTIGGNKCWLNSDGSVHVQAPVLLSTSSYGMFAYQDMPVTSIKTLEHIAREQPDVEEVYKCVGLDQEPLADLMPLCPSSFRAY